MPSPVNRLSVGGSGDYDSPLAAAITLMNVSANGHYWEWHALDDGRMQIADHTLGLSRIVIQPDGNVGIGVVFPTDKLHVNGGVTCTVLTQTSDRNAKENFSPVSPQEILAKVATLPITTWNFKELHDGRHVGPMAQDFHAAFGLGSDDKHVATVDADGVALAAIQGLNQKLEEKDAEIQQLKQSLAELKELVSKLADQTNPQAR
jgi:hypothetical protein